MIHQDRQLGHQSWAFKPEFGYSERWGNWVLDAYGGVWVYTTNQAFGPVGKPQNESPIGSFEGHFSHDFKNPGTWVSLDGNFWWGGLTGLSGIRNLKTEQTGSRIGGTAAWRFTKHQSLKGSYSAGIYSRFGGKLPERVGRLAVFLARLAQTHFAEEVTGQVALPVTSDSSP